MFACIDIGNTSIRALVFNNDNVVSRLSIGRSIKSLNLFFENKNIEHYVVSSVAPKLNKQIQLINNGNIYFLKHQDFSDIDIDVLPKESVGIDRLVDAYAAYKKWACNCLIIDVGTAITCCHISKSGVFNGGVIFPGVTMMQNSLHDATEQLPLVHFPDEKPSEVIGKTTELAMKSGMFYGALNMINGIRKQMKNELLVEKVILTGGVPHSLISHIEHDIFAPDLPYEGMKYIYPKLLETNVFKT